LVTHQFIAVGSAGVARLDPSDSGVAIFSATDARAALAALAVDRSIALGRPVTLAELG
jgi:hypothetical protein